RRTGASCSQLDGDTTGVIQAIEQNRGSHGIEKLVRCFFCALPVTIVVDYDHSTVRQQWVKMFQLVSCRFVPIRVKAKQGDLRWNLRRYRIFDSAANEMKMLRRIARAE